MKNKLTAILDSLTSEELSEAFLNIKELHENAHLGRENVFRRTHERIEQELGTSYSMHTLEMEILYRIAERSHLQSNSQEELRNALAWVVDQFEKVMSGQKAGNVVESLSFAKSLLNNEG
ncbi:hypothetical protein ACFVS2_25120 [Brevibacillus sp. NPDC058079]|uniref:hypothetical protein n=1 Tax=Brevibacillus sp. NPDC058079 TaxID=3346330 RepID=UPI0036ECCB6F